MKAILLSLGVAFVKQINGYFEIDILLYKTPQDKKNPKRKNNNDDRWRGLTRIRTDEIKKNWAC